nr:hypothetical protein [uncultured Cohaesibacter sp.]
MTKTANMFDLQRVIDFLKPYCEGGFGASSTEFICRCLEWRDARARAALLALKEQGKVKRDHCGGWVLVHSDMGRQKNEK